MKCIKGIYGRLLLTMIIFISSITFCKSEDSTRTTPSPIDKYQIDNFLSDLSLGLSADYQFLKYSSAALGIGLIYPSGPHETMGYGIILNNEFTFKNSNNQFVYSPQLTLFINELYYLGTNISYYTNFHNGGAWQFTPEAGIGIWYIFITYSYNFELSSNEFIPVNKSNLSVKLIIPIE